MVGPEQATEAAVSEPTYVGRYFSASPLKFLLMYFGTSGLYGLYWHYKNWKHIKLEMSPDSMPFWRAFFAPFWAFSLFEHVNTSATAKGVRVASSPALLAVVYFVLSALVHLPDPYWVISFLAAIPLLVVNAAIQKMNSADTAFKKNASLAIWQWPIAAFGISFLSMLVYLAVIGESIEEFTFEYTMKRDLLSKCDNEVACISSVKSLVKPCMEKSDWQRYLNSQDSEAETRRFTKAFFSCIVDEDGDPIFQSS